MLTVKKNQELLEKKISESLTKVIKKNIFYPKL